MYSRTSWSRVFLPQIQDKWTNLNIYTVQGRQLLYTQPPSSGPCQSKQQPTTYSIVRNVPQLNMSPSLNNRQLVPHTYTNT